MAIKDWKKDLENKDFDGKVNTIHFIRKDKRAIISINRYDDGYHFSHFPLGDNPEGIYFVKEKLNYSVALNKARQYMRKN